MTANLHPSELKEIQGELETITGRPQQEFAIKHLAGDASARQYYRARVAGFNRQTIVLMRFAPNASLVSEEFIGKNAAATQELPFLTVHRYLSSLGLPVPAVYAAYPHLGRVWLEDLGDELFYPILLRSNEAQRVELYKRAIDLLVEFQTKTLATVDSIPLIAAKRFDFDLLLWELNHFLEWGIEAEYDVKITPAERKKLNETFERIARRIEEMPYVATHRDYQSKNLFVFNDKVYFIDFQDALKGPVVYDLVALLRDSYVVLGEDELLILLDYYHKSAKTASLPVASAFDDFSKDFFIQTLQRKMKDSGRFVFIDRVKKNPSFLQYIPDSLGYVKQAFGMFPEYAAAREILSGYEKRLK